MSFQNTFERGTYVTTSMVPYIIYKTLLQQAREAPKNSLKLIFLCRISIAFELLWGCGKPYTVSREYLTEGPNRRTTDTPNQTGISEKVDALYI